MYRNKRMRAAVTTLLAVGALTAVATSALGAGAGRAVRGTAFAAITHTTKSTAFAAGNTSDNVLGNGAVTYTLKIIPGLKAGTLKASGAVTTFTKTGSLSGTTSGTETIAKNGAVTFDGKLRLTHGFGGQAGHSFLGTFTGTAKSSTGPYAFRYRGIYR